MSVPRPLLFMAEDEEGGDALARQNGEGNVGVVAHEGVGGVAYAEAFADKCVAHGGKGYIGGVILFA